MKLILIIPLFLQIISCHLVAAEFKIIIDTSHHENCSNRGEWEDFFKTVRVIAKDKLGQLHTADFYNYSTAQWEGVYRFREAGPDEADQVVFRHDWSKPLVFWPEKLERSTSSFPNPCRSVRVEHVKNFHVNRRSEVRDLIDSRSLVEAMQAIEAIDSIYQKVGEKDGYPKTLTDYYRHETFKSALDKMEKELRACALHDASVPELAKNCSMLHFELMATALASIERDLDEGSTDSDTFQSSMARLLQGASMWIQWSCDKRFGALYKWPDATIDPNDGDDRVPDFRNSPAWITPEDFEEDLDKLWNLLSSDAFSRVIGYQKNARPSNKLEPYMNLDLDSPASRVPLFHIERAVDELRIIWTDKMAQRTEH